MATAAESRPMTTTSLNVCMSRVCAGTASQVREDLRWGRPESPTRPIPSVRLRSLLRRDRCARGDPRLEGGDELGVGDRHGRAARAGAPAPEHERVVLHVVDEGWEVLAAVLVAVLQRARDLGRAATEEHH